MKLSHVATTTNSSWSAAGDTADASAELDETKTNQRKRPQGPDQAIVQEMV
jgi:hypothetical protein